jgi:MFS transporter, FSR family, fosmidomycin resistance protein
MVGTGNSSRPAHHWRSHILPVSAYGLIHALVDTSSSIVIYIGAAKHGFSPAASFWLVVAYNIMAFGTQPLVGLLIDRFAAPRQATILGLAMVLLGLPAVFVNAGFSVALAGTGNALFHAGCGAIVLGLRPGFASLPGLFVGPGAVGLCLGVWLGTAGLFPWPVLACALVAAMALFVYVRPLAVSPVALKSVPTHAWAQVAIALLLFAVLVRAACGRSGLVVTPSQTTLWFALGVAACVGKILGGFVADRIGMVRTVILVFALSAPLLAFAGTLPVTALLGVMIFQMTMPVTLPAISACLPGRASFAFGITCLALLIGSLPMFCPPVKAVLSTPVTLGLVSAATLSICVALWMARRDAGMRVGNPSAEDRLRGSRGRTGDT